MIAQGYRIRLCEPAVDGGLPREVYEYGGCPLAVLACLCFCLSFSVAVHRTATGTARPRPVCEVGVRPGVSPPGVCAVRSECAAGSMLRGADAGREPPRAKTQEQDPPHGTRRDCDTRAGRGEPDGTRHAI